MDSEAQAVGVGLPPGSGRGGPWREGGPEDSVPELAGAIGIVGRKLNQWCGHGREYGCARAWLSTFYVLEYDSAPVFFGGPGRLTRISPNGTRTLVTDQLSHPTSVAVGPDDMLYVSNKGDRVGEGEVLRITP